MLVLGIESSCDDTSIAIVSDKKEILSHITRTQLEEHKPYGGVVPEIASRSHLDAIGELITQALAEAKLKIDDLDAIAATAGPGLIGGVIVGAMTAKGICAASGKPFIAVNHLEGHALTVRLTDDIEFPYLLLLASGGHCQVLEVQGIGKYKKLGATLDDSAGEAFDKVAKMMHLGYPGGPIVESRALDGDPSRFDFPCSLKGREGCDFSFSGLKTAVKRTVDKLELNEQTINDVCASFQRTVGDIFYDRMKNALDLYSGEKQLVIAGGVAANQYLKSRLSELADLKGFSITTPPIKLCTDNGAMIAWVGIERLKLGITNDLSFAPKARWRLFI